MRCRNCHQKYASRWDHPWYPGCHFWCISSSVMLNFLWCGVIFWSNVVQTAHSSSISSRLGSSVGAHLFLILNLHSGGNSCDCQGWLYDSVPTLGMYSSSRPSCCMPPWGWWGTCLPISWFFYQLQVKSFVRWILSHDEWDCHVLGFCLLLGHWQFRGGCFLERCCCTIFCDLQFCLCGHCILPGNCAYLIAYWTLSFHLLWVFHRVKMIIVHVHRPIFHVPEGDMDVLVCIKFKDGLLYCM